MRVRATADYHSARNETGPAPRQAGFEPELTQETSNAQDVELIDLSRLYQGE